MRMGSFLRVAPRAVCAGSRCLLQPSEIQLAALVPRFIEVLRPQPSLVAGLQAHPIAVGHCKPGGIAILTLDDHMLAKDALDPRRSVRGITGEGGTLCSSDWVSR